VTAPFPHRTTPPSGSALIDRHQQVIVEETDHEPEGNAT